MLASGELPNGERIERPEWDHQWAKVVNVINDKWWDLLIWLVRFKFDQPTLSQGCNRWKRERGTYGNFNWFLLYFMISGSNLTLFIIFCSLSSSTAWRERLDSDRTVRAGPVCAGGRWGGQSDSKWTTLMVGRQVTFEKEECIQRLFWVFLFQCKKQKAWRSFLALTKWDCFEGLSPTTRMKSESI